jgi:hypothetical protein
VQACAGYRGGWESLPYIGETPPVTAESRTPLEAQKRSEFSLPGLTLGVSINNQLRTYDTQVYLFALPLSIDPRNVYSQTVEPGKTRAIVRVSAREAGFVFRPQLATLSAAGKRVSGTTGFEFGRWNESGNRVSSGGRWGYRGVPNEFTLNEIGRTYLLSIEFLLPVPPPDSTDIVLDLSQALRSSDQTVVPTIRFLPVRWKEGYT